MVSKKNRNISAEEPETNARNWLPRGETETTESTLVSMVEPETKNAFSREEA